MAGNFFLLADSEAPSYHVPPAFFLFLPLLFLAFASSTGLLPRVRMCLGEGENHHKLE